MKCNQGVKKREVSMILIRRIILKMIKINNQLLFFSSVALVFLSSLLIRWVEPETFPTLFDGFWWVMTTVTTVGYGDLYPVTVGGRLIAIFLYIVGIGLIGVVIGKVVDGLTMFRKMREDGTIVYKEKGHYIIIGWSQKAAFAVKEILATKPDTEVVIIDTMEKAPLLAETIHYVRGNAASPSTLHQANIMEAKAVLVFADDEIHNSQLKDGKTLLISSTIESLNPDVHTVVEVMEEHHIRNFEHVNVNEFIFSHETISSLAVRSAFIKGISGVFSQLLHRTQGDDLFHIPTKSSWQTYRDAFQDLLGYGATLIADRQNLSINRMLDEQIPGDAELYAICDSETYKQILKEVTE
nr:potassium channel family protein [Pontibacillus sp. ALD_SL1]